MKNMPTPVNLGELTNSPISSVIYNRKEYGSVNPTKKFPLNLMGYAVPDWQRPLVWTKRQKIKFIESAWLNLPLGFFVYNQSNNEKEDRVLIDGQQRMSAFQDYFDGKFRVFGFKWEDIDRVEQRELEGRHFASYTLNEASPAQMRRLYNILNFSGTPHTQDQKA